MASSIAFTDATGAATLAPDSQVLPPFDRFWNWTILTPPVEGAADYAVSLTGVTHEYAFRQDYGASFEMRRISSTSISIMDRLVRHLVSGGTCTVNTGDTASASYTCRLFPNTVPSYQLADEQMRWYTLTLSLKRTTSGAMTCDYR